MTGRRQGGDGLGNRPRRVRPSGWEAKGWAKFVLAIPVLLLAVPLALLALAIGRLLGSKSTIDLEPDEVALCLENFLEGRGGPWDWDDFVSLEITDPALDRIREAAAQVDLPLGEEGRLALTDLLGQVRAMKA